MIIILVIISSFTGLKQEISGNHFKNGARKWPYICWGVVISSYNDFRRSILSSLNFRSEVMMSPAPISHVTNFYHHLFIQFSSSLIMQLIILFFHFFNSLSRDKLFLSGCFFLRGLLIIFRFLVIILLFFRNIYIYIVNIINWIVVINRPINFIPLTFT